MSKINKQISNTDPRVAPKDMILTRRKSALQKRQLRDMDRSMKSITQLLKSPPRYLTNKSPKKNKNAERNLKNQRVILSKTNEIVGSGTEEEFHPNKLKRNLVSKKILLKPNYPLKVVAATNKRKRGTPKKEFKTSLLKRLNRQSQSNNNESYSPCTQSPHSEGGSEMQCDSSLDEEDWMEILTCPSPVWWEDPPVGYSEEAIFTRTAAIDEQIDQKPMSKDDDIKLNINLKKLNTKFIEKRSKLENLLTNIKNKTPITISDNSLDTDRSESSNISINSADLDIFSDLSVNEEEILKNLENIDIPIEVTHKKEVSDDISDDVTKPGSPKTPNIPITCFKTEDHCKINPKEISKESDLECRNSGFDEEKRSVSTVHHTGKIQDISIKKNTTTKVVDESKENDCNDEKKVEFKNDSAEDEIKDSVTEDKVPEVTTDTEYITVYKIMTGGQEKPPEKPKLNTIRVKSMNKLTNPESSSTKLNLFFKKCKNNRRNAKTKTDIVKNENTTIADTSLPNTDGVEKKNIIVSKDEKNNITVSKDDKNDMTVSKDGKNNMIVSKDEKIKYCYKCSAIYDTTQCKNCESDTSEVIANDFSCDMCDFVSSTRTKIIKHLISHKAQQFYDKL